MSSRFPRWMRASQRAHDLARIQHIIDTTAGDPTNTPIKATTQDYRNLPGGARILRMIPVCAEGVPGTAPGTDPYDMLDDNWPLRSVR